MRGITKSAIVSIGLTAAIVFGQAAWAATDTPGDTSAPAGGTQPMRFTMSPVEGGGFARLDTQTGQMSLCNRKDGQWLCADMADQGRGLAEEIERLRGENKDLKAENTPHGGRHGRRWALRRSKSPAAWRRPRVVRRRAEGPAGKYGLPSEQDVDQAIDYMERMFRKFRDKLKEFDTDKKGTPL